MNLISLIKHEKYKEELLIMARPKKKTERELIEEAQNLNEEEVISRLESLKVQLANVKKQKAEAKVRAVQLAKEDVFTELLLLLDLKKTFEECKTLSDFDGFCDTVKNKIKFLCDFYELNQNCNDIVIPKVEAKKEPESKDESEKESQPEAKDEPESKEEEE